MFRYQNTNMAVRGIVLFLLLGMASTLWALQAGYCTKVSPERWWFGMKNTELQLMIYGDGVSGCSVSVDESTGVKVSRVERTGHSDYLFVYLDIKDVTKACTCNIVLSGSRGKQNIPYRFHERAKGSAARQGFSQADAVYLLMPDRFANGDTGNDSVAGYHEGVDLSNLHKRQGGDIQGIIDHLDYIADLGMTALWTTPLFDDNDHRYSYHHYASTGLYNIDPRFGTNSDFKRLVDSCHSHGIKYIMDIVPNHLNPKYKWGNGVPDTTWYHQWPEFTRTNYQLCAQTDPYASAADKKQLVNGWFDTNMADLNLNNHLLADYIRQAYIYWIEYTGLDGIRVDTYPYNDIKAAAGILRGIRHEYPNMNLVGECWVKSVPELSYYQSGTYNRDSFDSQLPSVIDFILKDYLEQSFVEDEGWNRGMQRFYFHFAQDFVYSRPDLIMNMVDNHDLSRYGNAVNYDARLYKMGLALIALVRGFPQYYYGDELMLDGRGGTYEDCRHRFPGGWPADTLNKFTPEGRTPVENDIHAYLRKILRFRRTSEALSSGRMMQFIPYGGIYCFFRYTDSSKVMVVVNNNSEPTQVDMTRFDEMNIVGTTAYDVINDINIKLDTTHTFPPKTVAILDIETKH